MMGCYGIVFELELYKQLGVPPNKLQLLKACSARPGGQQLLELPCWTECYASSLKEENYYSQAVQYKNEKMKNEIGPFRAHPSLNRPTWRHNP